MHHRATGSGLGAGPGRFWLRLSLEPNAANTWSRTSEAANIKLTTDDLKRIDQASLLPKGKPVAAGERYPERAMAAVDKYSARSSLDFKDH